MSKRKHTSGGAGHGRSGRKTQTPDKTNGIHKDWRTWTVVGLMLGAMVVYVLSDDESLPQRAELEQETTAGE
jgi:hypothetical protein